MSSIKSYRDLKIWQKAISLTLQFYKVAKKFPSSELYGITQQAKRAVVSVPSNIAEGWGRKTNPSFAHFLKIARGSLYEFETQLELCYQLKFCSTNEYHLLLEISTELSKMLNSFISSVEMQINKN